jgi:hypothetical protein
MSLRERETERERERERVRERERRNIFIFMLLGRLRLRYLQTPLLFLFFCTIKKYLKQCFEKRKKIVSDHQCQKITSYAVIDV